MIYTGNNFSCWIVCDTDEINCHSGLLLNEVGMQPSGRTMFFSFEIFLFPHHHTRPHSWQSTAPAWREKKKRLEKNFNYRVHVDVSNKTLIQHLDSFTSVTAWTLPPFKLHNVMESNIVLLSSRKQTNLFP